jgi:C-terminal processing protease CtpA/Prc
MGRLALVFTFLSVYCLISLGLAPFAFAQCDRLEGKPFMSTSQRKHIFDDVWRTVRDEYIYTDFRGQDWQAARNYYSEEILTVETNSAFYSLVDQMIFELGDNHSVYLSPWIVCEDDNASEEDLTLLEPRATRLEGQPSILYIDLPSFNLYDANELLDKQLRRALQRGQVLGVVIDLRHNYGGYLDAAYNVLSTFVRGRLGTEYDLYGTTPVRREPGLFYPYLKNIPIVVFVDGDTHSAAELVAGVLEQKRSATIIGQTSAGNTEIVLPYDFEDGSRLWLAIGGFRLDDGTELEGQGVVPDVAIDKTAGDDVYIAAALEVFGIPQRAEAE